MLRVEQFLKLCAEYINRIQHNDIIQPGPDRPETGILQIFYSHISLRSISCFYAGPVICHPHHHCAPPKVCLDSSAKYRVFILHWRQTWRAQSDGNPEVLRNIRKTNLQVSCGFSFNSPLGLQTRLGRTFQA